MKAGLLIKSILVTIGWLPWQLIKNTFIYGGKLGVIAKPWLGREIRINWIVVGGVVILGGLGGGGWWIYEEIFRDLPSVNRIYNPPNMSTAIYDRNGKLLYTFYKNENRSYVAIDKIPPSLMWATIAIEDKDFFNHHGLSVKGILSAIRYDFTKENDEKPRGGSTITQQLAKNVFLNNEKSWKRKVKEAILAIQIERKLSKQEILEKYFNQVAYGGDVYGAQEAAKRYFGKNIWEINEAEAAYLAGLPAAPSSYSAFGENPAFGKLRQKHVVQEMISAKFITKEKGEEILREDLKIVNDKRQILAPHFVFYVKDVLVNKYGFENFERQGLKVTTSLDLSTQQLAESIIKDEVDKVRGLHISNGAALVINPKNGDILAMVGSKDYHAKDIDGQFNVTTSPRQPGSSIKPINYLLALENNWTLMSMIDDSPVSYDIKGQKPYTPKNYNGKYMGRVTIKTALASSLNIPSVKLLAENGLNNMINMGERMGITTWGDRNRFGLSLALGSGEVKMTELAGAYAIFANMGDKVAVDPILEIKNYLGEVVKIKNVDPEKVVEAKYAFLIDKALSDDNARAPIFGLNSKLKIDDKIIAVKTGTTNNLRDNWCIGWTPEVLVAAWVGNNDNTPMSWVASGISGATPIWNRIMREMVKDKENKDWPEPEGVVKSNICGKDEYFIDGTEQLVKCRLTPTPEANQNLTEANTNISGKRVLGQGQEKIPNPAPKL